MIYPLIPAYRVNAEDISPVIEESISTESSKSSSIESSLSSTTSSAESEISSSESTSSMESVILSSSSSSENSSVTSYESSSSSVSSIVETSNTSSSTSSEISEGQESVVNETSSSSTSSANTEVENVVIDPVTVVTPLLPILDEVVTVNVIENDNSRNFLENIFPFLFTDKPDYSPTESAVISGSSFLPNTIYTIVVSSSDNPPVNHTYTVLTSSEGKFTYVYQLDGTYRPNYKVEVKDLSGEVVATTSFTDSDTSYLAPSATSGNWSNGSNSYANGGGFATGTQNRYQTFSNFGFSVPVNSAITGIEVQADTWSSNNDFCQLDVDLSWNGGSNWTNQKSTGNLGNSETTKTLGTPSDNWGRTWNYGDFTNSNFRLRVQHGDSGSACSNSDSTYLDFIRAKVTYISNVAPVITEGTSVNVDMSVNAIPTAFALTLNATDADVPTQTLTWNISSNGSHGNASVSGSGNSKAISYTPNDNYVGTDSFTVRVSDPYGLTDTIVVNVNVNTVTNPLLTSACGNDIALVIDTSLSTSNSELTQSKNAMIGIVNALSSTPNRFSVVRFGTSATVVQGFTSNTTDVINAINSVSLSYGLTNLSAGISTARGTFDPRTDKPNLMIVASDGNPTWPLFSGLTSAINQSSLTKTYPIRMVMLGIGGSVNVNNLKAISGPIVGSNTNSDVVTSNFASFASSLEGFVSGTCGSITIVKDSLPDDPQDFSFTANNGLTPSEFNLDDDPNDQTLSNTQVFTNVPAGTYTFSEHTESGWVKSAVCSDQSSPSAVILAPGENVICTFTNTKNAHIIVHKLTQPSNDTTSFNIQLIGVNEEKVSNSNRTITNGEYVNYEVIPGTFELNEEAKDGWVLTSNSCQEDIVVGPGETRNCELINTKLSSIRIVKNATVNALDDFIFNSTLGTFTLDDDEGVVGADNTYLNSKTFTSVLPGSYTFSEVNPTSLWGLRDVTCMEGENTPYLGFTSTLTGITLNLPAGRDIVCTFNNVKGEVLGEQTGQVLAKTGDNSTYVQIFGLMLLLGSFGVMVLSKAKKKYSK